MQSTDTPTKTYAPFAFSGGKNTIPLTTASTSAASLTAGFPPLTRTPLGSGGVPPDGLDMNGILNLISQSTNWSNAGGLYPYDSAFSTQIGGYPKGAILLSADLAGLWLSIVENNTSNPDTGGTGWASLVDYGLYSLSTTGGTITLTAPQYAKQLIIISGTLSSNLQITFPKLIDQWLVINNAALGDFTVTAMTSGGVSIPIVAGANPIYGDGTNVNSAIPKLNANISSALNYAVDTGTANAYAGTYSPVVTTLSDGLKLRLKAAHANTGASTFSPNGLTAQPILNQFGFALGAGIIAGGSELELTYNASLTSWIMTAPVSGLVASGNISTIGDTTISVPAGSYRSLTLNISGVTTTTDYAAYLQVNGDTGANYNTQGFLTDAGATTGYTATGATAIPLSELTLLFKNSVSSGIPFEASINILNPANTTLNKIFRASAISYRNASSNFGFLNAVGQWASNAALTSLSFLLRAADGASPSGSVVNATGGTWYITGTI